MVRTGRLGADEKSSWSVVDLRTGERLVSIDADAPYQTASMVYEYQKERHGLM